jgi:hypothetical protein
MEAPSAAYKSAASDSYTYINTLIYLHNGFLAPSAAYKCAASNSYTYINTLIYLHKNVMMAIESLLFHWRIKVSSIAAMQKKTFHLMLVWE